MIDHIYCRCELKRYGECDRFCNYYSCGIKYCDRCGKEADWLYNVFRSEWCHDCLVEGCEHDEDEDSYLMDGDWISEEELEKLFPKI